jgi:small subunit ribosomal protein S9
MPDRTTFTGRRKSSIARARIARGSGQFILNGRPLEDYFPTEKLRAQVLEPFEVLEQSGQWDVRARLNGGGTTGQAGALRLALARALVEEDESWRAPLKAAGLLTRDARKVERKKYGLKKARRAPQFSKR